MANVAPMASGRSRFPEPRAALRSTVLYLPTLFLALRAWDRRWVTDDGFINFRVVKMVLAGHGPVFNVGERVESTTSALWLWILAAGDLALPFDLEWVAVLLGLLCAVAALALATHASSRLCRLLGRSGLLLPAGALVIAALPPFWDYATSGLEGGLTFLWLSAVGHSTVTWAGTERPMRLRAAVLLGLGPLVRPDLALVSGLAIAAVLAAQWRPSGWGDRLRFLAAALALPVAYQVFRMGYYATLVPNTALAKGAERPRWDAGWAYMKDLLVPYALTLPLVLLAGLALPLVRTARARGARPLVAVALLPVAGALDALYVMRAGGDYLHGRLLLPAVWAILVPFAVVGLPDGLRRNEASRSVRALVPALAVGALAVWAVVCAGFLRKETYRAEAGTIIVDGRADQVATQGVAHPVTADHQGWGPGSAHLRLEPADVYIHGTPLDAAPPAALPIPAYASFGIGIGGYSLGPDYYIVDLLGLADPVTSRFRLDRPTMIAHEKSTPRPWIAARLSDEAIDESLLPLPVIALPLYESAPGAFADDVAAARRALTCDGDIAELLEAIRAPMGPGRFIDNLLAAPRLTALRIPGPPQEAAATLCP